MSDKYVYDAASISIVLSTLAGWLPHMAALISIIWGGIRIYETKTVQGWINRRRNGKRGMQ